MSVQIPNPLASLRVDRIPCEVCGGTGWRRSWIIARKECNVCLGLGVRPILVLKKPNER